MIGALTAPSTAVQTTSITQARREMSDIRKRLAAAQGRADTIKKEVGRLDAELDDLNRQIASGQRDVARLESDIRTGQLQISELKARFKKAADASNARARNLYIQGPGQSVAMLFAAESISEFSRAQVWMEKSAEQDSKILVDTARLSKDLEEKQESLSKAKRTLDVRRSELQQRKVLSQSAMKDRQLALDAAEKDVAATRRHLEGLEADSARLTAVLRQQSAAAAAQRPSRPAGGDGAGEGGAASSSGFVRPVTGRVTSPFGPRWGRLHSGVDIDGNTGDPVRATKSGTIMPISCGGGYGICTIIDHGGGVTSLYAHMSRKVVSSGRVEAGQLIGAIGCSGSCTGSHIHFEIRFGGSAQNPMRFF